MSFSRRLLVCIAIMLVASGLTAIYLLIRLKVTGGLEPSEVCLHWNWENITVQAGPRLWLDPLLAAGWVIFPMLYYADMIKHRMPIEIEPLYGLVAAAGYYLAFWGSPSIIGWLTMALVAPVIGKIIFSIYERRATKGNQPWYYPYTFSEAILFSLLFGFGALLPLALLHGFALAYVMMWLYLLIVFAFCLLLWIPLWLLRLGGWLYRKARRQPA